MTEIKSDKITLFIRMRRCVECWHLCEETNTCCTQCGKLFIRAATDEEKQKIMQEIDDRKIEPDKEVNGRVKHDMLYPLK